MGKGRIDQMLTQMSYGRVHQWIGTQKCNGRVQQWMLTQVINLSDKGEPWEGGSVDTYQTRVNHRRN